MTNQEKIEKFKKITTEMAELYAKKNSNYGDSFGKLCEDLGLIAGLVPLHNKLDRLTNLIKGGENNFESIRDTLIDLANYAIMNLIEFEDEETTNEATNYTNEEGTISSSQTITSVPKPELTLFDYFEQKPIWSGTSISSNYPCGSCKRKNTTDCYNCKYSNFHYCTYNTATSVLNASDSHSSKE